MTDFNFLRIKWPKLAAIAADAGRLVEVSPSSAISTMQNFCEWAADIALDFYDINTQNGITQKEKLDTLKATGHVPADILTRFHNITMAGGRRLYKDNEDVEEARQCIEDVYEIGRWLNKEADRAGWPPKNDYYRPVMSSMGLPDEGGGFSSGRLGKLFNTFKPLILGGTLIVVVIIVAIVGVKWVINTNAKPTIPVQTQTPKTTATSQLITMAGDDATATPAPETTVFLDTLTPTTTHKDGFFLQKWKFTSGEHDFKIGDKVYANGIGMFIPKKSITQTQGTWAMKFELEGKYNKLRFDLGIDSALDYGTGYGKFRIRIYCDSDTNDPVYDSTLKEYSFTDLGKEVDITGCETLIIKLTEAKGTKGTLNVVLGNIRLVQSDATAPTDTSDITQSSSPGASASPDASSTVSSESTSASATATGDTGDNEEQDPGPT